MSWTFLQAYRRQLGLYDNGDDGSGSSDDDDDDVGDGAPARQPEGTLRYSASSMKPKDKKDKNSLSSPSFQEGAPSPPPPPVLDQARQQDPGNGPFSKILNTDSDDSGSDSGMPELQVQELYPPPRLSNTSDRPLYFHYASHTVSQRQQG